MNSKKLTVTIGIPAYNEGKNIKNAILSACAQKGNGVQIIEIIVFSDGSTDNTVKIAKSIKDNRIKVVDNKNRKGKPAALNNLFEVFKGDVLVILDADSVIKDEFVIKKLVSKFHKDNSIGVITGNAQPLDAETFIESAINNYIYARDFVFSQYSIDNTAHMPRGFLAYSRTFLKNFRLPGGILNDDAFSYFSCINKGYKTHNQIDAIVWYRSAQSVGEHIKQFTRYIAGEIQLHQYFGREIVRQGFYIPKMALIKIMLYQLIKNPLGYVILKSVNIYCSFRSKAIQGKIDSRWEVITTSKKLYTN